MNIRNHETNISKTKLPLSLSGHNYSLAGSEAASLAPTSSPYFLPSSSTTEEDSGLESMVTTTSDSSSNSSRSPPPPPPHYKLYTELWPQNQGIYKGREIPEDTICKEEIKQHTNLQRAAAQEAREADGRVPSPSSLSPLPSLELKQTVTSIAM